MSYLRKYAAGASGDINRPVIGTDGNYITSDAVFAAGDVLISIDGGASAPVGTLPNYVDGFTMTFVFTNLELTGKRVLVTLHDQDGTAFADDSFEIETFGNASAAYPPDYSTGIVPAGAITNDSFASDVGSTAIATNVIGIAAKKGVVDALNVDTYAEPGQEAPAATNTLVKKIGYVFKAWRNKKTKDATSSKLYADDGTTVDQKTTDSDDGTTGTRGEVASGP